MPTFVFEARDRRGKPRRGTTLAASLNDALATLRQQGMLVVELRPGATDEASVHHWASPGSWLPPSSFDIELSLQQLALMLRSGLSLLQALSTVAMQARRQSMRRVWQDVAARIEGGTSLAEAMAPHRCFPRLINPLVRVGEQTGYLDEVLRRASASLANARQLRTQVLTALAYPAIVTLAALGISAFLILYVIPKLKVFLDALGRKLPWMTQLLVDLADFIQTNLVVGIVSILLLTAFATFVYLWPPGRLAVDRFVLRVPIVGQVFQVAGTAVYTRTMSTLLRSGITLVEALRTTESLLNNRYLALRVNQARARVVEGGTLAEGLSGGNAFTPMLASMTAVGESAGTLAEVMEEVAGFHEEQLASTIRRLSVLIEPAIIIVVGGIVGFVYMSFFLALFAAGGAR